MKKMNPVIELENVTFSYNKEPALEGITLSINRGDYDGIIGPNGGGKTTLLMVILGLLKPNKGKIKLFGQPILDFKEWPKIGYLPQKITHTNIRFPITVQETVNQGRIAKTGFFRKFSENDKKIINHVLKISDVLHLKDRLISDLSGGERQRTFIARALASEPEVLILDEPATGIDITSQSWFYSFLKELNSNQGITILFVSHEIGILRHEATRLICINRHLICDGASNRIFEENKDLIKNLYGGNINHIFGH
jgi:zinc transport system ATP-binding protein